MIEGVRRAPTVEMPIGQWRWLLLAALVVAFVFWNPVGYVGGGADDDRYIAGATCWLTHSPCLPVNHWEGRWPVVGALAISAALFGFSKFGLALPFLLASFCCLILIKHLADRLFAAPVGLAAALIFGLLPVFAIQAMSANVEQIELLFILVCFTAILDKRSFVAGLALGIAFQARETSVAALLPVLFLYRNDWKRLVLFAGGFAFPLLVEFTVFYAMTGDPLYRRSLSVGHAQLPSSELKVLSDGLPFFNATLMQNWKYEPGLHIHWILDGFANLVINPKTGLLFIVCPAFTFLYRDRLNRSELRLATFIIVSGFMYAAILIYGLSIDPKPRVMYVPMAGISIVLGLVAVRAWNNLFAFVFAIIVVLMALTLAAQPRNSYWQRVAERLNARYPGQVETSQPGLFFLSPRLSQLPPMGSGKPYLLVLKSKSCPTPSNEDPLDIRVLTVVAEEQGAWLARSLGDSWSICLFRYDSVRLPSGAHYRRSWRGRIYSPRAR